MKNKKILKRVLALLCASTILVGGTSGFATESSATSSTPSIPAELEGYTRVTPESFGITSEAVHTYAGTNIDQNYYVQNNTDFNGAYLDADISLTDTQETNINGGFGYLNPYMLRLYISGTTLVLYSIEGGYVAMYQADLGALEISAGEYFNLKLATDITDNEADSTKSDVKVQMWVNNTLVTPLVDTVTVSDAHAAGSWLNVTLAQEGTIKITAPTIFTDESEDPEVPVDPDVPENPEVPVVEDIPAELEGKTKITPASFGITSEVVHTYVDNSIDQSYYVQNTTDFGNAYLDADISLTETSVSSGFGYLNPYLIRVYITSETLAVYSLQAGVLMYQTTLSSLEISEGEYFNLKLATDLTESTDTANTDVKLQVWVNNKKLTALDDTVTVPDTYVGSWLNVSLYEAGTIKITAPTEFTKEQVVTEAVSGLEIPTALEGYKMVTPSNFGITEELIYSTVEPIYSAGTSKWVENITDFNKTYFNADIALTDTQSTNINAGFGYLNQYMFRFYISGTTLVVYSIVGGGVVYQEELATYGIKAGEYFNLKFATDFTEGADTANTDVKVQMWLNNTLVTPKIDKVTVADAYANGNFINMTLAEEGTIKIKPYTDYVVSYSNISEYRSNGNVAPTAPEGYIFAGWYSDSECSKEDAVTSDYTSGPAYAKFVDKNLLTVKAQITAGTTASSSSTNIRFVTSVNDLNYKKVGFKIIIHKATGDDVRDRVDNVVYHTLTAMVGDTEWQYKPQGLFCGTATCFKAWIISGITSADFNTEFEVTPYWETLDGTVVEGKTETKTVSQGFDL